MSQRPEGNKELETLEGERGLPSVNQVKPSSGKRTMLALLLVLVLAAALAAGYWKVKRRAAKEAEPPPAKEMTATSSVPKRTFGDAPAPPAPEEQPVVAAPALPVPAPASQDAQQAAGAKPGAPPLPGKPINVVPAPQRGQAPANPGRRPMADPAYADEGTPPAPPKPTLDKSSSGLMVGGASRSNAGGPGGGNVPGSSVAEQAAARYAALMPAADAGGASMGGGGNANSVGGMLSGTKTPPKAAGRLGNRNFLLTKGSFIECALQTRLDTTVPGMTACVLTKNVYSNNGKILLMERGSVVTGEYQSGMRQGQARIFVLWTRVETPSGIVVNLDSPGTDALGGGGIPGVVDNHFWQRFGGALMLSLVSDAVRSGSNSSGAQNMSGTVDASQNMATEALRSTINIPPTLYKNQGDQVGIYIARDLDFSTVYDVAAQ